MKPPLFQIASTHDFKTHNTIVLHGSLSQGKSLEHTQFQFEKPHHFNLKPLEQKLFFISGNTKFQFEIIWTCFRALHQTYTPPNHLCVCFPCRRPLFLRPSASRCSLVPPPPAASSRAAACSPIYFEHLKLTTPSLLQHTLDNSK